MFALDSIQVDGETHVTRPYDVLDFELLELGFVAELLHDPCKLPSSKPRVFLALSSDYYHFSTGEYQSSGLRLSDPHNDSSEPLGVVLCIPSLQSYLFEVQFHHQVACGHHVLDFRLLQTHSFLDFRCTVYVLDRLEVILTERGKF